MRVQYVGKDKRRLELENGTAIRLKPGEVFRGYLAQVLLAQHPGLFRAMAEDGPDRLTKDVPAETLVTK